MIDDGTDDWPPDGEWLYVQEYVTPTGPWWRERDNVIAGTAGVVLVILCIVGFMAFTGGKGQSTDDRLPVVIGGSTTSTPSSVTTQTSTTTLPLMAASVSTSVPSDAIAGPHKPLLRERAF